MEGESLTAQESARLRASREQFAAFWVVLERRLRQGRMEADLLPFLRQLAALAGGCESFLRAALALAVFHERGLLAMTVSDGLLTLKLNPTQGKVDLFASPYLARLQDAANRN